jgi:hypothetical protein
MTSTQPVQFSLEFYCIYSYMFWPHYLAIFSLSVRRCSYIVPLYYIVWGIKISHNSRSHCAGCSGGRVVGQVSCGWLVSTVFSTHHGLDRWTSGLCCYSVLSEQPLRDSDAEGVPYALGRNASVPDRKTILLWISNLRSTGTTLKIKSPGRPRTVRMPKNVEPVTASIQQSPQHSARKHANGTGDIKSELEEHSACRFKTASLQNDVGSIIKWERSCQPQSHKRGNCWTGSRCSFSTE